jgi:hypothetical protein
MYIEAQRTNQAIFFNFKSIIIYLVYICCNFINICFFLKVENLNLATNLEDDYFYAMLITCKCTPLCEKLDCNVKS